MIIDKLVVHDVWVSDDDQRWHVSYNIGVHKYSSAHETLPELIRAVVRVCELSDSGMVEQ